MAFFFLDLVFLFLLLLGGGWVGWRNDKSSRQPHPPNRTMQGAQIRKDFKVNRLPPATAGDPSDPCQHPPPHSLFSSLPSIHPSIYYPPLFLPPSAPPPSSSSAPSPPATAAPARRAGARSPKRPRPPYL